MTDAERITDLEKRIAKLEKSHKRSQPPRRSPYEPLGLPALKEIADKK